MSALATEELSISRMSALEALLDADERRRVARLASAADCRDVIAAHGLLKEMLRDRFGLAPADCRLSYGAPGTKPRLVGSSCAELDVNITHSRGMVACAVGTECLVGIDAEPLERNVDLRFTTELLSADERCWLNRQSPSEAKEKFLRLWTLKEAVMKADGRGLGLPLDAFAVLPDPPRVIVAPPFMGERSRWVLRQWTPTSGYVVALAYVRRADDSGAAELDDFH
ncbi:MAG TPA: 4'-phosphopantetheinyl transferase superfamily protein [Roseiarcus sp.]